jgi:GNAT superfamily N-acetyltransferase
MPATVERAPGFPIETLTAKDIASNVALAQTAGWKDAEGDWQVAYETATVLGVRGATGLVAQVALGIYAKVGVIAKLVVAPEFQHQGLGRRLLEAALTEAASRQIETLGLVTTAVARPLFEQVGFAPAGDIVVLMGSPTVSLGHGHIQALDNLKAAQTFDQKRLGCDRAKLLRARERQALSTASVLDERHRMKGYAMATPFGPHAQIGPVVADADETAETLVLGLCRELEDAVRIDVPAEQTDFRRWLRGLGLREQGTRVEMARGGELPWRVPARFALATQPWG